MKKTNVLRLLDRAKIAYQVFEYEYDPVHGSAKAIAQNSGIAQQQVFKTLVAKGDKTGIEVAVVPTGKTLHFKTLCKWTGNKKMALVPVKALLDLTGYVRGGCSPIGMKKNYSVTIDQSCEDLDLMYVNAGQRGILVGLHPTDLIAFTKAQVAPIGVAS